MLPTLSDHNSSDFCVSTSHCGLRQLSVPVCGNQKTRHAAAWSFHSISSFDVPSLVAQPLAAATSMERGNLCLVAAKTVNASNGVGFQQMPGTALVQMVPGICW